MRLFIAINFDAQTRARLATLGDQLRARSRSGNFSRAENLHLTLAFLGEGNEKRAEAAKTAMKTIHFRAFAVSVERVGRFQRADGDVWWAGLAASETLMDLQSRLTAQLVAAGFILEKRRYRPHITLGRRVVTDAAPWSIEPFGETVGAIDLMKSERQGGGMRYTSIYSRVST